MSEDLFSCSFLPPQFASLGIPTNQARCVDYHLEL